MTITPHPAFRKPGGETACRGRAGCALCVLCTRSAARRQGASLAPGEAPVELAATVWNGERLLVMAWHCTEFTP